MKTHLLALLAAPFALGASSVALAQLYRPNQTYLAMPMDIANGIVPPSGGPSRVRVPPGEYVTMTATLFPSSATTVQWTKNGAAIPGATSLFLTLPKTTAADSGTYNLSGLPFPNIAYGIQLDVVPEGHLANLSSRVQLIGDGTQIVGFVVTGTKPKSLLFRAVGPTLKSFGVENTAARPTVRCYDAAGRMFAFAHIPEAPQGNELFQSVGAFPVSADELPQVSYDWGPFPPGAYTLHVTDAAKAGGTALVEIYEMP